MKKHMTKGLKIFVAFVIIVVVGAIIASFMVIGSPQQERVRKLDRERVEHLDSIENALTRYWEAEKTFPEALSEIEDFLYYEDAIRDPETNEPYQYDHLSDTSYMLCATFMTSVEDDSRSLARKPYPEFLLREGQFEKHGQGDVCFTRTLDIDRYNELMDDNIRPLPERIPSMVY